MTEPTDAEIWQMWMPMVRRIGVADPVEFARAVLDKWGQPAHSGEPVYAFRRKGIDDFCTCTEKRYAELSAKPNLFETRIFYTAPQPVVREPLTDEQIRAMCKEPWIFDTAKQWVRLIEAAHDIQGVQHGAE